MAVKPVVAESVEFVDIPVAVRGAGRPATPNPYVALVGNIPEGKARIITVDLELEGKTKTLLRKAGKLQPVPVTVMVSVTRTETEAAITYWPTALITRNRADTKPAALAE